MLYRLFGLMLGRVGRRVGTGGAPFGPPLGDCIEPLSEVEVAGVVPEDARVEVDFLRETAPLRPLPLASLAPLGLPSLKVLADFSDLKFALDFRRRLPRKEGMTDECLWP